MTQMTVAVSEDTFQRLFAKLREGLATSTAGSEDLGAFNVAWNVGIKLKGGSVDLQPDGTVRLSELDVVYDPLSLTFGLDLPEVCVGGFCLLPPGAPDWLCAVKAPRICVFSAAPDVSLPINIGSLLQSEISGALRIKTRLQRDPARTTAMTDLDAEDAGVPDKWQFLLDPEWLDIDLLDIPDIIGNILDAAINNAVDGLLGWLPGWAKDLVKAILSSIVDLIRTILDIGDDIDEWLSNLLGVSIGLFDFVVTIVADWFANRTPVFAIESPYPVLGYSGGLIPVKVPIENVSVTINDAEMIIGADIGA